jgi:hypothetical protein
VPTTPLGEFLRRRRAASAPRRSAVAANSVAGFRLQHGRSPGHPRLRALLAELQTSTDFAELWARHDARGKSLELKTFCHRQAGPLTLRAQTFEVRGGSGQELVVYRAEPGSPSAAALGRLTALVRADAID